MSRTFSPEEIARDLAHKSRQRGTCASDDTTRTPRLGCDCVPGPGLVAECWAGRARMAKARLDGRAIVAFVDEKHLVEGIDGLVREEVRRRFYIETDLDVILDDTDREALRREGIEP